MVSQDLNSKMGKILEINLNTQTVKMVSRGHRNPEGLIVTKSGALLSAEHGPAGGDELNVIVEGANYGWPIVTLGTEYGSYGWHDTKVSRQASRVSSANIRLGSISGCVELYFRFKGSTSGGTAIC